MVKARYRVRLKVPAGRDYRLFVWAPGITEMWQKEGGCFAFLGGPRPQAGRLQAVDWSGRREAGRDEAVTFTARRAGIHYLLVNPWLRNRGNHELRVVGVPSISIAADRTRVPVGGRTRLSGKVRHPDCGPNRLVWLQSKAPGGRFKTIKKSWGDHNGVYGFGEVRMKRTQR